MPLNATEKFVYDICRTSFLSLWSYANPQGESSGKELCDVLVICDPDVIVFSVKEIKVDRNANAEVQFERWTRKAIEASARQLYGAERWINSSGQTHVVRSDGNLGVPFPPRDRRRIHRVAIALGGEERFPLTFGDLGRGFVHVFDERGCDTVLDELDTIGDFVAYLQAKEEFFGAYDVLCPGEENLLAVYLNRGRVFPTADQPIFIKPDSWEKLIGQPEFKAKQVEDRPSYICDNLLEVVGKDVLDGNLESAPALTDSEKALRVMARENRFARRMLGKAFSDFLHYAAGKKLDSRMMESPSGVGYVFLVTDSDAATGSEVSKLGIRASLSRSAERFASLFNDHRDRNGEALGDTGLFLRHRLHAPAGMVTSRCETIRRNPRSIRLLPSADSDEHSRRRIPRHVERIDSMRIWDDIVTDLRGVLSWSVDKQGEGLAVFEVSSSTFSSCFKVPFQRRGISDFRVQIAEEHRTVLEDIGRAAAQAGAVKRVNRVGMDDPHYAIDDEAFRRLAAQHGFDWRR